MLPPSKVWHTSDKENFVGNCDMEAPSGWPCHPSEKQKQLEYEQQEFARCHDAKAQKMHEQIHHQQLAEEGSKDDIGEEDEVDCQSDSGDEDTEFTHQVVRTKLSKATNEQLKYHDGKVPKALNTKVHSIDLETHGETVTTDDELSEDLCTLAIADIVRLLVKQA
ncbi:hypothetical protein EDC04DRAFT_2908013 [Pisolithus marmoratus]|nr:hypothetical protein EDC04DRAFT_2908013 [Pisolithus marmoratus]